MRLGADACALAAAWSGAAVLGHSPASLAGGAAVALLALAVLGSRGVYDLRALRGHLGFLDELREAVVAISLAGMAAVTAASLTVPAGGAVAGAARTWALGVLLVAVGRASERGLARHAPRPVAGRVLIVGAGRVGVRLERRLRDLPELSLEPVGFLDSDPLAVDEVPFRSAPVLGPVARIADAVRETGATHVMLAFSSGSDRALLGLIETCRGLGVEVWVVPRLFDSASGRVAIDYVGGMPVTRFRPPARPGALRVKGVFDRAAAVGAIALLAPVLLGLALAVRLSSPGPVLFRQRRIGRDGVPFDMLKFRSMEVAPTSRLSAAGDERLTLEDPAGPGGVEGRDRRTWIGRFMRDSSLDELPQLFNIARGEMSLVGPRPERPQYVELFADSVERYTDRHRMKAGLTGWAQVHGLRGQTSLSKRVEWDNWYIDNWSLWVDLKILLMTCLAMRKGAR